MASDVQICNRALIRLGADTITALTEDTKEGRLCNILYTQVRQALLRSHPWNFAITRAALASSTTTPAFEFSYTYPLPSDCLRVWTLYASNYEYKIEGRNLLTNDPAAKILYIKDVTDASQFDSLFSTMLSLRLGIELAYNITSNASVLSALTDEYTKLGREAKLFDGQEGSAPKWDNGDWLDSRY